MATCPCCGRLTPLTSFDGAPYDVEMFTQQVGGRVRPGVYRVSPSGRVTDHSHNRRGSITNAPSWDPALAEALEDQLAEIAANIEDLARSHNLARPGRER